jgi:polar amino acid transport system permease protein
MESFEWNWAFFFEYLPVLLHAGITTVVATFISFAIALLLGLALAIARGVNRRLIRWPASFAVEFIRRTPLLVQIYYLYYVLPDVGLTLPAMTTGILALGLHYSTYTSEVYRAGIQAVPRGQWDAVRALSLGRVHGFRLVILPQALAPIVPALGNYLITLFKETPLLSAIAVVELLQQAKIIGSLTFRYVEPITTVAFIFLILSLGSSYAVNRLERHLRIDQ